ncbi:MAG: aldehyde:ferredoxin oxidoreductase, partial [Thermoplasmata archaeon]
MKGYSDRVLRVDLSSGKSTVEDLDEKEVKLFLGGLALAAYRLYKEVPGGADPLGKENKLIFSPGLLVGTGLPTLSKSTFVFKSPLTGGFGRAVAGAKMGVALKKAGYDLLIVEGKSKAPVYLRIKDDEVSLEDAGDLWGKNAFETQNMLKEKYGKCNTAAIGPAGENLSFISSIDLEERQAARGGPGAVMGSKKLKAIAVTGTGSVDYYNLSDLKKTVNHWVKIIKDHPATKVDMDYGTGEFYAWMNKERGTFPSRNWQWGYFHTAFDGKKQSGIDPYNWVPKMRVGRNPCPNCTKPCSQVVELKKYSPGTRVDGPEYETIYSLGGELEIDDPEGLAYLNYLCDVYGLDTISAGVTIGWAMEAYERGLLSKEDVDGVDLRFGNIEA